MQAVQAQRAEGTWCSVLAVHPQHKRSVLAVHGQYMCGVVCAGRGIASSACAGAPHMRAAVPLPLHAGNYCPSCDAQMPFNLGPFPMLCF
jgi:hypothetical protein